MQHQTIITTEIEKIEMIDDIDVSDDDDDDDGPSSPESAYDDDLMHVAMDDDVTAQLAAAGPVGVAAAAAIASAKKRKRPHSFETNPSIRKRQQNRLLRKLRVSARNQSGQRKVHFERFDIDCVSVYLHAN